MTLLIVAITGAYFSFTEQLQKFAEPAFFRTIIIGYCVFGALLAVAGIVGPWLAAR